MWRDLFWPCERALFTLQRLAYALRFAVRRLAADTAARSADRTDLADRDGEQADQQVDHLDHPVERAEQE